MDARQEPSYQVVEIFQSINGEGQRAGERAAFVRMKGCNLACSYCDTSWANEPEASFRNMGIGEILDKLSEFHVKNVTVTGGEPLVQKEIVLLLKVLAEAGYRVEVETNGSVPLEPFRNISSEIAFTVDYKLPGSGMEERMLRENFRGLAAKDTVKFVVSDRADLEKAYEVCERELSDCRGAVYLSPVFGRIEPEEMVAFMTERKWNRARLQIQLHKVIWDPEARGV
ncbi:MAG: putative 7-carboxy-7-deazaguanine synthase QueE [Eubacterium sp.]|nr:putative 7-carboxy-7-deazaguanine synthase QueE [Eubacterium sp.]